MTLAELGIGTDGVASLSGTYTAQAYIITDPTTTRSRPSIRARWCVRTSCTSAMSRASAWIVAPDGRDGMRQHAAEFRAAGIPYVFDPGQGLPLFSGDELTEMIEGAAVVTVNATTKRSCSVNAPGSPRTRSRGVSKRSWSH